MGRTMTADQYESKLEATNTILSFMGELVPRYKAVTMTYLWNSLQQMCQRYGLVFVADCIKKNKAEAELALSRYGKKVRA